MLTHISFHLEPYLCYEYKTHITNRSPDAKSTPNYRNNLPKCGRMCTRGTSPPTKLVNDDDGGGGSGGDSGDSGEGGDGRGDDGGGDSCGVDTAMEAMALHQWQWA